MSNTASCTKEIDQVAHLPEVKELWCAHPSDVLTDPSLDREQKRSILASWLSDRYAIPDAPRWRRLENGAFVDSYEVRDALYKLDGADEATANKEDSDSAGLAHSGRGRRRSSRRRRMIRPFIQRGRRDDDDDDPPPRPTGLRVFPSAPIHQGGSAMPVFVLAA